jgi:hypothetical protein
MISDREHITRCREEGRRVAYAVYLENQHHSANIRYQTVRGRAQVAALRRIGGNDYVPEAPPSFVEELQPPYRNLADFTADSMYLTARRLMAHRTEPLYPHVPRR